MTADTKQLEPVITLVFDKAEDESYFARMTVSGIPTERQAEAVMLHMQRLFCGEEQEATQ